MLAGWQPQYLWAGASNDDRGNGITKTHGKRKWRDSAKGNKLVIKGHLFLTFLSLLSSNSITPIPPTIYTQQGACVCAHSLSRVRLSATPWTAALPGSSVHGFLQARLLEWVAMPSSRRAPWSASPALQADSLLSDPTGKGKNSGVGSLPLLQGIFPTQEPNCGLLNCTQILYQLTRQESPIYLPTYLQISNLKWKYTA